MYVVRNITTSLPYTLKLWSGPASKYLSDENSSIPQAPVYPSKTVVQHPCAIRTLWPWSAIWVCPFPDNRKQHSDLTTLRQFPLNAALESSSQSWGILNRSNGLYNFTLRLVERERWWKDVLIDGSQICLKIKICRSPFRYQQWTSLRLLCNDMCCVIFGLLSPENHKQVVVMI